MQSGEEEIHRVIFLQLGDFVLCQGGGLRRGEEPWIEAKAAFSEAVGWVVGRGKKLANLAKGQVIVNVLGQLDVTTRMRSSGWNGVEVGVLVRCRPSISTFCG